MTESNLITQLQQRNEKAHILFIQRYEKIIYSKLHTSGIKDKHKQDDIFQEVVYATLQLIYSHSFKQQSKLSTLIYRITHNKIADSFRKEKILSRLSERWQQRYSHQTNCEIILLSQEAIFSERTEKSVFISRALEELKPDEKLLFHKKVINKESFKEISLQMNITEVNARVRMNRIRGRLIKFIESYAA